MSRPRSSPVSLGICLALVAALLPGIVGAADAPARMDPHLVERLEESAPLERLIVFVHAAEIETAHDAVREARLVPLSSWDRIGVAVAAGTPDRIRAVAEHAGVEYVEADRPIEFHTDTSHDATRGWHAMESFTDADGARIDGRGVTIAINDTGIDADHRAFQREDGTSKVVRNLKSVCPFIQPVEPDGSPFPDLFDNCFVEDVTGKTDTLSIGGHGTHVGGTAAGVIDTTADGRTVGGAAPGADLVDLSVGQAASIYAGAQGLYWVLNNHEDPCADNPSPGAQTECDPIRVVNNSWGPFGGGSFNPDAAVTKLQRALVEEGIVVIWAAGNDGGNGSDNRTNPPGEDPTPGVIMVANYDDGDTGTRDGTVHPLSSRGRAGSPGTYPDISAPGTNITQACSLTLPVCQTGFDTRDPEHYGTISGTSMAAPHVAGIVAQMFQADPALTPGDVERIIKDTAHKYGTAGSYEEDPDDPAWTTSLDKGQGLIDAAAAIGVVLDRDVPPFTGDECDPAEPQVTDPEGDAIGADPLTGEANQPALDVVEARLTSDPETLDVTFAITVSDLRDTPPLPGEGEWYSFFFSYGAGSYEILMLRSQVEGERFAVRVADGDTLAELEGTFDVETDTVSAVLPATTLAETAGEPVVSDGEVFAELLVWTRYNYANLLGLVLVDEASGRCSYAVGSEHADDDPDDPVDPVEPPTAEATVDDDRPRAGQMVTFDASGSTSGEEFHWDLGDGTTATGEVVTHTYERPGRHDVVLTVTNAAGEDTATLQVVVRGAGQGQGGAQGDAGADGATAVADAATGLPSAPLALAVLLLASAAWLGTRAALRATRTWSG